MMTETVCFEEKLLFVMQNLGIWGDNRDSGQNMWSKMSYLESPTLICLFTMQLLWGYNDQSINQSEED